jgi:hypothetical protein
MAVILTSASAKATGGVTTRLLKRPLMYLILTNWGWVTTPVLGFLGSFLELANQSQIFAMDANQRTLSAADKVTKGSCKAFCLMSSFAPSLPNLTRFCAVLKEQAFDAEFLFHLFSPLECCLF